MGILSPLRSRMERGYMGSEDYVLNMNGITKSFGGVHALQNVTLNLRKGETLALAGENGAGKSTLIKTLMGINKMEAGEILLDGAKVEIAHPSQAMGLGVCAVFQDLSLVNTLTIAENVFLSKELHKNGVKDSRGMSEKTGEVLRKYNIPLSADAPVSSLSAAQKQLTEIVKAIAFEPRILILDEPTASLTERETEVLFRIIDRLKRQGTSVIYISHRMNEVIKLADRVMILRDGRNAGELTHDKIEFGAIVKAMVGREINMSSKREKHDFTNADAALSVKHLNSNLFHDISFEVKKGEILGFAGLAGAGRTELVQSIFGIRPVENAQITLCGEKIEKPTPAKCLKMGLGMVPEERLVQGLVTVHSIEDNIVMSVIEKFAPRGFIRRGETAAEADRLIRMFNIKTESRNKLVCQLSGGNAQKVVFAKWIAASPKVLILDESTAGIDVQSKYEIREIVQRLADEEGLGVIFISSELPELLEIADRILIMNDFHIAAEVGNDVTQEEIMSIILNDKINKGENRRGVQ